MNNKAISVFLPAFGLHLPNLGFPLQEQNVHPLSVVTPDGLDLDFSALMAFDNLIIDKSARAHIMEKSRTYLRPMRDTLRALEAEDLTTTIDFGEAVAGLGSLVEEKTNNLLEDVDYWRPRAADHWRIYRSMLPPLLDKYKGHCDIEQEKLHFGVYCHLRRQSDRIDLNEGLRLNRFIQSGAKLKNRSDRQLFQELIRPIVQHTVLNTMLRDQLESPFIDWDDLNVYYSGIARLQVSTDRNRKNVDSLVTHSKEIFSAALPDLRPKNVAAFIKFRKTSEAFRSFQAELLRATQLGAALDQKWAARLRDDASRALLTQNNRAKRIKWILSPLKVVAPRIMAAGELISELTKSAGAMVEVGIDHVNSSSALKYQWYYTLLEINSVA
jgi:hypothetical protein